MKKVLFVCTGNTCRSPLAEYLLKHKANEQIEVKSAGIAAFNGSDAAEPVKQLLGEKGITVEHQSQMVTPQLMDWADFVLTMTESHAEQLQRYFPQKKESIFPLKAYVNPESDDVNISDPFGGSVEVYKQTMIELEELINKLLQTSSTE